MLIVSMAFGGHSTMSAASTQRNDKLQKVEQKENSHDAVLTDASNVYRVCNCRPQRIVPTWLTSSHGQGNKLPYYHRDRVLSHSFHPVWWKGTPGDGTFPL